MRAVLTLILWLSIVAPGLCVGATAEPPKVPRDSLPEQAREQLDQLELELSSAVAASPTDPVGMAAAYGELGRFYFLYDFLDAAEIAWGRAAELQPQAFRWHYLLGAMLRLQGDFDRATTHLESALSIRPNDVPALIRLARIHADQSDTGKARALFEQVLEVKPDSSAAHYGLGRIAVREDRFEDALAELERALPGQPEGSTVHHQLGLAYRGLGDLEKARLQLGLNQGVRVGFSDPLVEGLVGTIDSSRMKARAGIRAQGNGRLDLAARLMREASELDPDDAWVRYNLGVIQEEMGDAAAAEREFAEAVRLDPDYRNAQYNLAQLMVDRGDLAGAVQHLERAREIDPQDHAAWLELSVALSHLGESERALTELRALVEFAPSLVEAKQNLAVLLAQLDRDEESLLWVEEILGGDATREELAAAHLLAGQIIEPADRDGAVAHYHESIELDPTSSEARTHLAMGLGRLGRFGESAEEFSQVVSMSPEDPDLRMGQVMALLLGRSYAPALAALEAATKQLPDNPDLSHTLARLLATCPDDAVRDGERALGLAQGALERRQTLDHAETVGMALAELGRFEEAVELQRQVVEQSRRQGLPPQALSASERYLSLYSQKRPVRAPGWGALESIDGSPPARCGRPGGRADTCRCRLARGRRVDPSRRSGGRMGAGLSAQPRWPWRALHDRDHGGRPGSARLRWRRRRRRFLRRRRASAGGTSGAVAVPTISQRWRPLRRFHRGLATRGGGLWQRGLGR